MEVVTRRSLNTALWVVQVMLAVAFVLRGGMNVLNPSANLASRMEWGAFAPTTLVRILGLLEAAGALGLLLPARTRIWPVLTPVAAVGLSLMMTSAVSVHLTMCDLSGIGVCVVLFVAASFVAWGRFSGAPIAPRAAVGKHALPAGPLSTSAGSRMLSSPGIPLSLKNRHSR